MFEGFMGHGSSSKWSLVSSLLTCACLGGAIILADSQPGYTLPLPKVHAIPAFARKYGLPCSACHSAWPELNNFGQVFRDNGYQLMNDRDSPIWQNPTYWPMTLRITPNWHYEHTNHVPFDGAPANGGVVQQHGFDLSGVDIWTAGTLFKNVSFSLLPSSDSTATFHFENAYVRFDNLLHSSWLNVKAGKFELDNLISEKRFLFLSANGGLYQTYHFVPVGDSNTFGIGDNQLGVELFGHSINSYTRYSASLLSSNEGQVGFGAAPTSTNPAVQGSRTYDAFFTFSQAFELGKLGLQRLGAYYYVGRRPTIFQSLSSAGITAIPGTGTGNKSFYRVGFAGDLYVLQGKWEFLPFFMHGYDNAFLGTSTPANIALPAGAQAPTWNGGFIESHYYYSPQLVLTARYEIIRMSRQACPVTGSTCTFTPDNLGNIDAYSAGFRWYPIMFSRAGLAWHNEFSLVRTAGAVPLSGQGPGLPAFTFIPALCPATTCTSTWSRSLFTGFDFDF
jgi:hypothetical protein